MGATVVDNTEAGRFELLVDGEVVAIEEYDLRGDRIALVHTEVLGGHDGKGYARALVEGVLDESRRRGLGVLPYCPYVKRLIEKRRDEYGDLVPADARSEFGVGLDETGDQRP